MRKPKVIPVGPPVSFSRLFFDIETEARDDAMDFAPNFAGRANTKDPEKIAAQVQEKRQAFLEDAALSPVTGRILLFAYAVDDGEVQILEGDEAGILEKAWDLIRNCVNHGGRCFGYNIHSFDLHFMFIRAAALGLVVPPGLWGTYRGRFYWSDFLIDLMVLCMAGQREFHGYSLKNMSKLLGVGEKNGDGAVFSQLYKTDRTKAIEYVNRDVELVRNLAKAFSI